MQGLAFSGSFAACGAAAAAAAIVSWYLETAFGLKESHSLVVVIKTVLFLPFPQMSVVFLPLQPFFFYPKHLTYMVPNYHQAWLQAKKKKKSNHQTCRSCGT